MLWKLSHKKPFQMEKIAFRKKAENEPTETMTKTTNPKQNY